MSKRTRSRWGWGFEDAAIGAAEATAAAPGIEPLFGFAAQEPETAVPFESVELPEPEIEPPPGELAELCSQSKEERAEHSYGSSYLDTIRAFRGLYEHVPDVVARPQNEQHVAQLLDWASSSNVAVIPYGGGTSVVGGVEPNVPASFNGTCSLDLGLLDRVLEVDPVSRSALIAHLWGSEPPDSDALKSHVYALRKQLEAAGAAGLLVTIPQLGYRLAMAAGSRAGQ